MCIFPPLHGFASKEINLREGKKVSKMCAVGNTNPQKKWGEQIIILNSLGVQEVFSDLELAC